MQAKERWLIHLVLARFWNVTCINTSKLQGALGHMGWKVGPSIGAVFINDTQVALDNWQSNAVEVFLFNEEDQAEGNWHTAVMCSG